MKRKFKKVITNKTKEIKTMLDKPVSYDLQRPFSSKLEQRQCQKQRPKTSAIDKRFK